MALHPIPNGVQHHRMLLPAVMLSQIPGFEVRQVKDLNMCPMELAHWADVIIVSRVITEFPEKQAKVLESLKSVKAKLVVDLDDHWILPHGHPNEKLWKQSRTAQCIRETLERADMVWTTNQKLQSLIENVTTAQVHVVKNGISKYDTQWAELEEKLPFSELMIGVSAAPNHYPDLKRLRPAFELLRNQRGWRILAMGARPHEHLKVIELLGTDRILFEEVYSPTEYAQAYRSVNLLVCPLDHTLFNQCRSDIKLAEAAHSQTPVMVEDFGPYSGHHCAVKNWNQLADVVQMQLGSQRGIIDQYRIADANEYYSTEVPDQLRVQTLKELVGVKMEVVR